MADDTLIELTRRGANLRAEFHAMFCKEELKYVTTLEELERVRLHYLGRKGIFNTLFKICFSKEDVSKLVDHYYDLIENPPMIDNEEKK